MKTNDIYNGFDNLLNAVCKNSDDIDYDLEFIRERIEKLPEYFNVVVTSELSIKMAYVRYTDDVEQLQDTIQNIDSRRREKHISLTNSINQLNRMCDAYQIPRIFNTGRQKDLNPELKEDREIAVDMCYTFCKDVFLDSRAKEKLQDKTTALTTKERDEELYKIGQDQLGTFHPEIMRTANIGDVKSGTTLQKLIEQAEVTAKPAAKTNQEAPTHAVR